MSFKNFFIAAGEAELPALTDPSAERYRLCVDDSFCQHQIIRIERNERLGLSLVSHAADPSNCLAGETVEMPLRDSHWECLQALLKYADYWQTEEGFAGVRGFDGAITTLEGWRAGRQHRVVRWETSVRDGFGEFGLLCDLFTQLRYLALRTDAPNHQWSRPATAEPAHSPSPQ